MQKNWIVVGAGMTGAVFARKMAEQGCSVTVWEKRDTVGGNSCDRTDGSGIRIHCYGPHIFHTDDQEVWDFLSRFTSWRPYTHKVLAGIDGEYLPLPFNLNSAVIAFGFRKALQMREKLVELYGEGAQISILDLRRQTDPLLKELADYVYENVFLHYSEKQWGFHPDVLSPEVLSRVPIRITKENRYFTDRFQGIPEDGYTLMFEKMLTHENITLCLQTDAKKRLSLKDGSVCVDGTPFDGEVLYTGALDALFDEKYGRLPYRSLEFRYETRKSEYVQLCATVNYPMEHEYTRSTEFKHLTGQKAPCTTLVREYPKPCSETDDPFYPILTDASAELYRRYAEECKAYPNLHPAGRLAEFRYYNMDAAAASALRLWKELS